MLQCQKDLFLWITHANRNENFLLKRKPIALASSYKISFFLEKTALCASYFLEKYKKNHFIFSLVYACENFHFHFACVIQKNRSFWHCSRSYFCMNIRGFFLTFSETLECLFERVFVFEKTLFAFFIGSCFDCWKQFSFRILLKRKEKGFFLTLVSSHRSQKVHLNLD